MVTGDHELFPSASQWPAHADLVDGLRREVEAAADWRWLELSCSLASGRVDEFSDVDAGIGHDLEADDLAARGLSLVHAIGSAEDVLVHADECWPPGIIRLAVEYRSGVQLDLVLMPATRRLGLPDGALALVDKDGVLAQSWTPPVAEAAPEQVREWLMLGWWALSHTAKYVHRQSLFEAIEALHEARRQALRLFAAAHHVPFPSFGLVSLLDFEPFELPTGLEATYAPPNDGAVVLEAASALADLLDSAALGAAETFDTDLTTQWASIVRQRLITAEQPQRNSTRYEASAGPR